MTTSDFRQRDLARIHLAKKQLGLDDEAYRDLLRSTTGQTSAAELDARQRWAVLLAFGKLGWKGLGEPSKGRPAQPEPNKAALVSKIEAQLAEARRPWAYAHGLAKRMFGVDMVQWCDSDQLRRLVAALTYDAKRHGRDLGPTRR
jgi:phage gp16-like protein